ncbi:MAG: hypothetical protein JOZ74_10610 [Bradyrhizobium sp.]|nr:hypothetical protein [Bradyrhizobium sp.]
MLRWTLPGLLSVAVTGTAWGADLPVYQRRYAPPQAYAPYPAPPNRVEDPALISPPTTPILPGSSALPGYYGRAFDYDYQGAYYGGGPYPSYFWRLPYACGVYGYC